MKLFFTGILCSFFSILSAQQVFPSHDQNPIWSLYHSELFSEEEEYAYSLKTEAEIILCDELWTPVHRYNSVGVDEGISMYYRQSEQKVFYRLEEDCDSPDYLMYDFSLEPGDTVTIRLDYGLFDYPVDVLFTVAIIDEEEINGVSRKRLLMHYNFFTFMGQHNGIVEWVEGIGDLSHNPFYPVTCFHNDCQSNDGLRCLTTDNDVLYSGNSDLCVDYDDFQRWYVDQNTLSGPGNGSNWENAFATLQLALDFAEEGDTIWVADGIYYPEKKIPGQVFGGNKAKTFVLRQGIVLLGGFEGNETLADQRDWEANQTILSGNIGEPADSTDNCLHVLYTLGTDSTTVLDGFIIQEGHAVKDGTEVENMGGGILIDTNEDHPTASPTIRNCSFLFNTAKYGGAMYCRGQGNNRVNPGIENCTFKYNRSTFHGGAIYKMGAGFENKPMEIKECVFENNIAGWRGGGIFFFDMINELNIQNCEFLNNYSLLEGGGICMEYFSGNGRNIIDNCSFVGNDAHSGGGFMFYYSGYNVEFDNEYTFEFSNCEFEGNIGRLNNGGGIEIGALGNIAHLKVSNCSFHLNNSSLHGGGLYVYTDSGSKTYVTIENSVFYDNYNYIGTGGAISCRGFSAAEETPISNSLTLSNSIFYKNTGALSYASGYPGAFDGLVKNCTFYDNGAYVISKNWSPDFNYVNFYNKLELSNSIIWEPDLPLKRIFYNGAPTNINLYDYVLRNNLISAEACNLPGGWEACGTSNIFDIDPLFMDMEAGDLRVAACSPAINSGDNAGLDTLNLNFDIAGNERILENTVDIGAYERLFYSVDIDDIVNVNCNGQADGEVYFSGTGDAPYSYQWVNENSAGTSNDQLGAGQYTFTITDVNNCTEIINLDITEPDSMLAYYSLLPSSGESISDGSVLLDSIVGGIPPYTFFWNTGASTSEIVNLLPGTYNLTITDSNGCLLEQNFVIDFVDGIGTFTGNQNNQFNIFPNPNEETKPFGLEYKISELGIWKAELFRSNGQNLKEFELQLNRVEGRLEPFIDVNLSSGVYLLILSSPTGQRQLLKLVVL